MVFLYGMGVIEGSNFILLQVDIQLFQHHFFQKSFSPYWIVLVPLLNENQLTTEVSTYLWTLFHMCLCLCQYHTALITLELQYFVSSEIRKCEFSNLVLFSRLFWLFVFTYDQLVNFCQKGEILGWILVRTVFNP